MRSDGIQRLVRRTMAACSVLSCTVVASAADLSGTLSAVGLGPRALAASGLTLAEVSAFLGAINGSDELSQLVSIRAQLDDAEGALRVVRRNSDPLIPAGAEAIRAASQVVLTRKAAAAAAADAVVERGLSSCQAEHGIRVRRWRAATQPLPPEFRIAEWSAEDRRELSAALLEERIAAERGYSLTAHAQAVLQAARSRPEVAEALQGLTLRLSAIETAIAGVP